MKSCVHRGIGGSAPNKQHVYFGGTDALLATFAKGKEMLVVWSWMGEILP